MSFEIAKAGWLHRQSSVLRRWKKNWFVLNTDGILRYFESPDSHVAEEAVRMKTECTNLIAGLETVDVAPPDGHGRSCLLNMVLRTKTLFLCAESPDDMNAWQVALQDARLIQGAPIGVHNRSSSAPPPYSAVEYPPQPQMQGMYPTPPAYSTQPGAYPQQTAVYGYPGQRYYGSNPPQYVVEQPGQTTVVYTDNPHYRHRRRGSYDGGDMAMGVVAGAALGSMMWTPLLWW